MKRRIIGAICGAVLLLLTPGFVNGERLYLAVPKRGDPPAEVQSI